MANPLDPCRRGSPAPDPLLPGAQGETSADPANAGRPQQTSGSPGFVAQLRALGSGVRGHLPGRGRNSEAPSSGQTDNSRPAVTISTSKTSQSRAGAAAQAAPGTPNPGGGPDPASGAKGAAAAPSQPPAGPSNNASTHNASVSANVTAPGTRAASEPDQIVPRDQWPALLNRLEHGELRSSGDVYVYLVQAGGNPAKTSASSGGISGKFVGCGAFSQIEQGKRPWARWVGQGQVHGSPGRRIDASPLRAGGVPGDHYIVMSRRPPEDVGRSGQFPDAQLTTDQAAIAWHDAPAAPALPSAALPPDPPAALPPAALPPDPPAAEASDPTKAVAPHQAPTAAPSTAVAVHAGSNPMRWTRVGGMLGGAAGATLATTDFAGHLALPAATASACFIYRGSMAAWRTRLGTLINRHVAGAGSAEPEPHLNWIDRWLVKGGAAWGIHRRVRREYGTAVETLRAKPGDRAALATLARAPAQLYMPYTIAGDVNDVIQAGTLAANVSINGAYVLHKGVHEGVAPFLTNLGFGLSNVVLSTKNLAARLAGPLRAAKYGVTTRVQKIAQATVMTGYSLATIPWAVSDFETGTPMGLTKGALDVVFGLGASVQAMNDGRALKGGGRHRKVVGRHRKVVGRHRKEPGAIRVATVHPLMFLGVGAVARFALQWATLK